jgi:hypothetical protein
VGWGRWGLVWMCVGWDGQGMLSGAPWSSNKLPYLYFTYLKQGPHDRSYSGFVLILHAIALEATRADWWVGWGDEWVGGWVWVVWVGGWDGRGGYGWVGGWGWVWMGGDGWGCVGVREVGG